MQRPITPPTLEDMIDMADVALESIPPELAGMVKGVAIRVEDFPNEETCRDMELESPFDLLGLYVGTPFGEQSVSASRTHNDLIFLYRRPILDYWCDTGEDLAHVVTHVLIHEIGHHFGFSDDDMEALEAQVTE
ncbi:metallopeptidase family protein [Inquilinus sp. CAU 1745]|uniref:metallopeptidase family protein n=1 Tax=Inquilinus sp. CAU 1745 TaxID=3140369 RepID=UPI00325BA025